MKFIIQLITIIALAYILSLFLPWWSIVIAGFFGGYMVKSSHNFLAGFFGIGLLWSVHALIINITSAVPLADKIAQIMMVNSAPLLILITGVIGGLVGGLSAVTGSLTKKEKRSYY
jgi:hypothetical protein